MGLDQGIHGKGNLFVEYDDGYRAVRAGTRFREQGDRVPDENDLFKHRIAQLFLRAHVALFLQCHNIEQSSLGRIHVSLDEDGGDVLHEKRFAHRYG